MSKLDGVSADRIAEYFVKYLFKDFRGTSHVRRVAAWVGLIVLGIQRGAGHDWYISHRRQLWFSYAARTFKVKYNHRVEPQGGIEIVEVLPEQGSPEGDSVTTVKDLAEAERFYNEAPVIFREFV